MSYYNPTSFGQKIYKLVQLAFVYVLTLFLSGPKKMKSRGYSVLMIVPQLDRVGGYEIQALQLSTSLAQSDNLVTILTDRTGKFPYKEFRSGFLVYRIPFRANPTRWNVFFSLLWFLIRKHRRYNVAHVHGVTGFSLLAARIARFLGLPVLLKPATAGDISSVFSSLDAKQRRYQKWLHGVNYFVAVSDELKQEMISFGIPESRIRRIPNFVNTVKYTACSKDRKRSLRARFGVKEGTSIFLFLGRLVERKGVEYLLRAWQKNHPGALWIVGTGEAEAKLKNLASELKIENVVFHGATQAPLDFYQAADVFVFPSTKEGFPNVLLEAMSCGLPCISTEIGGVVDVLEHRKQGLLVPPASVEALADAIQYVADHKEEAAVWGEEAAQKTRKSFDLSIVTARYMNIYNEL